MWKKSTAAPKNCYETRKQMKRNNGGVLCQEEMERDQWEPDREPVVEWAEAVWEWAKVKAGDAWVDLALAPAAIACAQAAGSKYLISGERRATSSNARTAGGL